MKRMCRHHRNPLLGRLTPIVHDLFRKQDCIMIDSSTHTSYHCRLRRNKDFEYLVAQAEELDSQRFCSQFVFADALDELWNTFLQTHPQFDLETKQ